MNANTLKHVIMGLGLSLPGSGCVSMDTLLTSEEVGWRMPEDARVEQLEARTAEAEQQSLPGALCAGFKLTADEARWVLSQSREISYQDWEALPCEVSGRLRSDAEPQRDIRFTLNVLGTAWVHENGRSYFLECGETCERLLADRS